MYTWAPADQRYRLTIPEDLPREASAIASRITAVADDGSGIAGIRSLLEGILATEMISRGSFG